jgi:hypothetical protein
LGREIEWNYQKENFDPYPQPKKEKKKKSKKKKKKKEKKKKEKEYLETVQNPQQNPPYESLKRVAGFKWKMGSGWMQVYYSTWSYKL